MTEGIIESSAKPLSSVELALSWKRKLWRNKNEAFEVFPGVTCVKLTRGRYTLIDTEDWPRISHIKWHAYKRGGGEMCALGSFRLPSGRHSHILMSRVVMNAPDELDVDHINGRVLINRKFNLRCVTTRVNLQNRHDPKSSSYPGVSRTKNNRWEVEIYVDGKTVHLGRFDDELQASEVYRRACSDIDAGCFVRPPGRKYRKVRATASTHPTQTSDSASPSQP